MMRTKVMRRIAMLTWIPHIYSVPITTDPLGDYDISLILHLYDDQC